MNIPSTASMKYLLNGKFRSLNNAPNDEIVNASEKYSGAKRFSKIPTKGTPPKVYETCGNVTSPTTRLIMIHEYPP